MAGMEEGRTETPGAPAPMQSPAVAARTRLPPLDLLPSSTTTASHNNTAFFEMDYSDTFPRQFPSESSTNPPGSARGLEPPSRWLQGGPALEEIRSTFGRQQQRRSISMVRKRKRPAAPTKENYNTTTGANHHTGSSSSGSDEGYNGSVSENERSTESSSSDDDDDDMLRPPSHEKRNTTNTNTPRLLLRKRSLVPPYSEIDDFGSEYCSDDGVFFSSEEEEEEDSKPSARYMPRRTTAHHNSSASTDTASILAIGGDVMAHILTFLEPPHILQVLTAPLCRTWTLHFTSNTEVWRVLCLTDPFKATNVEPDVDFRWLYTSFVRCLRYLVRMTQDSRNGRPLTIPGQQQSHPQQENYLIASNRNLHRFFSRARAATQVDPPNLLALSRTTATAVAAAAANPSSPSSGKRRRKKRKEKTATEKAAATTKPPAVRYGRSSLTQNLLGPTARGVVGQVELPWSCAMYSIVNWMVGFRNVEGIQTMCLKALPVLLEDEQQRTTARQSGLTELVLRSMVAFPDSVQLHAAAFHTIVLLARPMGGREGMLFHATLVDSNGIFSSPEVGAADGKSGMAVLLDSMRRFLPDQTLQAMGCWSMVNIALVPAQKNVLIKLGAIDVALQAMVQHAASEEVQFRALFALINLIIPAEDEEAGAGAGTGDAAATAAVSNNIYDDVDADRIVDLVVTSMQTFYSHNAILNRACLVLHNLSLNTSFHTAMLWSPRCYQILEYCLTQYRRTDPVLYQGALRTLHRLQLTLSSNEAVRRRFLSVLRTDQQKSLRLEANAAVAAAAVVEAVTESTTPRRD